MSKVLYVEDHPAQRDILAQMLELNGFEVAVASDGLEGVEKARSWLPDLILMDLRMPKMDGFEAIKVIRSEDTTNHIPIIAISAWASSKHQERALAAGADEHFKKAVVLNELLNTIGHYLKEETSVEERDVRRQDELSKVELETIYAERNELAFQFGIWQTNAELASTLEHLTKLTSGIIHDLRNRLGVLQNYTSRADYCLRFLNSLAFLRFKPSLSRKICKGNLEEPEISITDLLKFNSGEFQVKMKLLQRKKGKERKKNSSGITVNGLMDSQMISQGLWSLFQSITDCFSKSDRDQIIDSIEIEDKRLFDRQFGFYITISSKPGGILPSEINYIDVLSGDELALCLFLLQKATLLNEGTISTDKIGEIEIKIPAIQSKDTNLRDLQSSVDWLGKEISTLSKKYFGQVPEPNIYPLIKGFVAAISRELNGIASEAKSQKIILRNCRYAQLLLQNLIWLGAGFELPKDEIDVAETLQSVQEILGSEIRERTDEGDEDDDFIEVNVQMQSDLRPVLANRVSLQQVFMNLITNALEAMPESGVLTLRAFQTGSEVHAEVRDNGGGISPENTSRIFDLAFSTKPGQERGTGLYIVKSIVDRLGGRVEVESELGLGTTFRVCLQST